VSAFYSIVSAVWKGRYYAHIQPKHIVNSTIRLPIRSIDLLLDEQNCPIDQAHLHPEVVKAIWSGAYASSPKSTFSIEFAVPPNELSRQPEVQNALAGYFTQQKAEADWDLKEVFRNGWTALFFGVIGLAVMLLLSEALVSSDTSRAMNFLGHTLVIVAWVVLWIPLEKLLYEHIPIRRRKRYAHALAEAQVRTFSH
jgi:hypothetical protein